MKYAAMDAVHQPGTGVNMHSKTSQRESNERRNNKSCLLKAAWFQKTFSVFSFDFKNATLFSLYFQFPNIFLITNKIENENQTSP